MKKRGTFRSDPVIEEALHKIRTELETFRSDPVVVEGLPKLRADLNTLHVSIKMSYMAIKRLYMLTVESMAESKGTNPLIPLLALIEVVFFVSGFPFWEGKTRQKEVPLLFQYIRIHRQRSEDAFNELTYYQEWLLKKGYPLWKVRIIYHWRRSCTRIQLLKSIALGSAKQLFNREIN